jgi:hypothetical protein
MGHGSVLALRDMITRYGCLQRASRLILNTKPMLDVDVSWTNRTMMGGAGQQAAPPVTNDITDICDLN